MKLMKWNWGKGIGLAYITAVFFLFLAVYKSLDVNRSLVVENYYEEDINYQKKYDKISNLNNLESKPSISINDRRDQLIVSIPSEIKNSEGSIKFYKADDARLDFESDLNAYLKDPKLIDITSLQRGKWKVSLDFTFRGKDFYMEENIYL